MSIQAIARVLELSKTERGARLVMFVLANYENDDGESYPAIETIAKQARLDQSTIYRILPELERMGEVKIAHGAGPHGTNRYRICLGETGRVAPPLRGATPTGTGCGEIVDDALGRGSRLESQMRPDPAAVNTHGLEESTATDSGRILNRVCDLGVDLLSAQQLVLETPTETLEEYMAWAEEGIRSKQLTRPGGWLLSAVRGRWVAPKWITQKPSGAIGGKRYTEGEFGDFVGH